MNKEVSLRNKRSRGRGHLNDEVTMTERDLKLQIKEYLAIKGIFNFPLVQGLGAYRGAPDRIMHLNGKAVYLEIKLPKGKMSDHQLAFQKQCESDGIDYRIIKSIEDLQNITG